MAADSLEQLAEQAAFVFAGTVQQLGAATLSAITPTEDTAVVRVDEVLRAPAAFGDLVGQEITVQLLDARRTAGAARVVFFAAPWLYGDSIAVQEVGHRMAEDQAAREYVAGRRADEAERVLRQHLADVAAVVVGQVHATRPLHEAATGVSEHDPQWWEASLSVESAPKGDVGSSSVAVLFPASLDIAWYRAPKPRVGDQGVWLLHRRPDQLAPERYPQAFVLIDGMDALPRDRAEIVARLV